MFRFGQKNGLEKEKGEQKMQKIIGLLLILGMAVTAVAIPNIAEAALTGDFTITVTISYLEISMKMSDGSGSYTAWALGGVTTSDTTTMETGTDGTAVQGIFIDVGESSAFKLSGQITNDSAAWTGGTSDTPAPNVYLLAMQGAATAVVPVDMTVAGAATAIVLATDTEIANATGALGVDIFLYGAFTTPETTTTGAEQSITVTITIAANPA